MDLSEVFDVLQPSIVAFGSKLAKTPDGKPPLFPPVIGTGFVVDECGIVATNRHVVEALLALPRNPLTNDPVAYALVFSPVTAEGEGYALEAYFVDILGYQVLDRFVADQHYYGESLPDLAFVWLKARGLPAVKLATEDWTLRIGGEVATAGFPLGEEPLVACGVIGQATPLLRRGIISGLNPFPCPQPHGFTIDIMSQGGASGSPIFLTTRPEVVGILYAGFSGTNITFAITSYFLSEALRLFREDAPVDPSESPTFDELRHARNDAPGFAPDDWTEIRVEENPSGFDREPKHNGDS